MLTKNLNHQISTGFIVGLSSIVYALSHGALLFSGSTTQFISVGTTAALITAIVCAISGCFFKEKTFVMGTDSSTVSVMIGSLLVIDVMGMSLQVTHATILAIIFSLSIISGLIFYLVARLQLANYVRFVPFSVMAGLLASTGWLMCSGALMIISGVSLSRGGIESLINNPFRPELFVGFVIAITLMALAKKISSALIIPLIIIVTSFAAHFLVNSDFCFNSGGMCSEGTWYFASMAKVSWQPFWQFHFSDINLSLLLKAMPSMLIVAFVGVITILLAIASLELSYKKEFDLNQALRVHAATSVVSAFLGGFLGIISTGRTTLNRLGGGGVISAAIAALLCLLMLIGGGQLLTLIPRVAMGGVILFLGLSMLKNWIWDQRTALSSGELLEIALILIVVANFGYLAGFGLGIAMACIAFVIACSKTPLTSLRTDLSMFSSSVVRHERQRNIITASGHESLIFKLNGYVFFGSASNIDLIFHEIEQQQVKNILLDFSEVIGVDRSAIGVFHRILRREKLKEVHFYFVYSQNNEGIVRSIAPHVDGGPQIYFYAHLDLAVEAIEESILNANEYIDGAIDCLDFIDSPEEQCRLVEHCQLQTYEAGEVLCKEGDNSNQIYFLKKGALEIIKEDVGGDIRLAKLGDGAIVGEMAFYSGEARTATIRATASSSVYVLDSQSLVKLRESFPLLANQLDLFVIKKLAGALARANKLIASLH